LYLATLLLTPKMLLADWSYQTKSVLQSQPQAVDIEFNNQ
jgi:hypothetical protein